MLINKTAIVNEEIFENATSILFQQACLPQYGTRSHL